MDGHGCFTWANKDQYTGSWKSGHMHGKGKKVMANGDVYIGDWKHDRATGKGELLYLPPLSPLPLFLAPAACVPLPHNALTVPSPEPQG